MTGIELVKELQAIRKERGLSLYSLDVKYYGECRGLFQAIEYRLKRSDKPGWSVETIERYANLLGYELILVPKEEDDGKR